MSERQFAVASLCTDQERRSAALAEMVGFLVADAAGASPGIDGDAGTTGLARDNT